MSIIRFFVFSSLFILRVSNEFVYTTTKRRFVGDRGEGGVASTTTTPEPPIHQNRVHYILVNQTVVVDWISSNVSWSADEERTKLETIILSGACTARVSENICRLRKRVESNTMNSIVKKNCAQRNNTVRYNRFENEKQWPGRRGARVRFHSTRTARCNAFLIPLLMFSPTLEYFAIGLT